MKRKLVALFLLVALALGGIGAGLSTRPSPRKHTTGPGAAAGGVAANRILDEDGAFLTDEDGNRLLWE